MTDEPIESIPPPRPGTVPGSGHAAGLSMSGNPFMTPMRSIPPEIRAIPARTPGFAPRQRSTPAEPAALRPAEAPAPPQQIEVPVQEVLWEPSWEGPEIPDGGRRRNNLIIGASAAAAVAVAIGAISLTHGSSPPTSAAADGKFNAAFGPGAGDPTEGAQNGGQPLDGATSVPGGQSTTSSGVGGSAFGNQNANPPATPAPPPKPSTSAPKPPPASSKPPAVCTGWHTSHVPAQDGKGFAAAASALRSGPYDTCGSVGSFRSGQHMYIWCHAANGYGATWVYGRIDNASPPGWLALTTLKPGAKLGPVC
ncbi:hypothetical protein [Catenulispora rubra]|uniref:hypothetical protein n=1 Tax=Catenulispora rubra TaxID=280293 RepID=UPI001892420B|nr:hypothetical protein [Catenulispora rubra]